MITPTKEHLRAEYLAKRKAIGPDEAKAAAQAIAPRLLNALPPGGPHIVAGYRAIRDEVDIARGLELIAQQGHTVCLPVVVAPDAPLEFHAWRPGDPLIQGKYSIEVPLSGEGVIPDVVIVPLVAFDASGQRLGYGAGYYDRTLAALTAKKDVRIYGAAYSLQQAAQLPYAAHDQRLDLVITEKGVMVSDL